MALVIADRVRETTTTTGTGTITLGGAVTNFETFTANLSNSDTTYYCIVDNTNGAFEVGLGTFTASGTTLARTTIIASSNSNSAVDFGSGTKDVFITIPASKMIVKDTNGNVSIDGDVTVADGSNDFDVASHDGTNGLKLGGTLVTASATDINLIDGITNGTVIASKAIITDSNKDISGGRNITISGELDAATLDISGDADIDGTLEADAITVNGDTLATVIAGTTVNNATLASTVTVSDSTANTNFPVVFHDESNALLDDTGALRYNPSTGELLVPKLTVAGTTTTVDTVTINAQNAIVFEGATADSHETTLTIVDPTADRTISLPNQSGTIPLLAAVSTTQITSTPEELNILNGVTATASELNILDGVTATTAELNYSDTGASVGTVVASKVVTVDANKDVSSFRNITLTGELDAGSLDVSGDADIDGTLEADAITVNGTALATVIADEATALAIALG